jgi:hypothetical protein
LVNVQWRLKFSTRREVGAGAATAEQTKPLRMADATLRKESFILKKIVQILPIRGKQ